MLFLIKNLIGLPASCVYTDITFVLGKLKFLKNSWISPVKILKYLTFCIWTLTAHWHDWRHVWCSIWQLQVWYTSTGTLHRLHTMYSYRSSSTIYFCMDQQLHSDSQVPQNAAVGPDKKTNHWTRAITLTIHHISDLLTPRCCLIHGANHVNGHIQKVKYFYRTSQDNVMSVYTHKE